tara:strand:- start:150 stop:545 length:396 start_codon:yes stop_codon:yes gene_type:complete
MSLKSLFLVLIFVSSSLAGCTGDDDIIFPSMTVMYSVDCECDQLYVEYQTEDTLTFGYVTLDEGVWISDAVYFPESEYLRELYIYAADEDEDGQSTTLIILIQLVDSYGVERADFEMIDGVDPDGEVYYYW